MKKISVILTSLMLTSSAFAECVHERRVLGASLVETESQADGHVLKVETEDGRFVSLSDIQVNPLQVYNIQKIKKSNAKDSRDFTYYNRVNIEYYRYARIQKFMAATLEDFKTLGYETVIVGKSLEKRDLYGVRPVNFDPNKKTIVMFGRHHGDEGTANWIIEGFVKDFLKAGEAFHNEYQLVLYPMINPDGAEDRSRYNMNDRDLNRSWHKELSKTYDEARVIHTDLKNYLVNPKQIVIALDMHGSFTKDFIYRVKKNYITPEFFNHQQKYIDELGAFDRWQKGNYELSNGHPKMARIVMINTYGLHALTHETPRDIKLNNTDGRSRESLESQGAAVLSAIQSLYN